MILLAATTRNSVKPRSYQRYTAFVEKQVRKLVLESITDSLLTTFHVAFQTRDSRLLIYALGGGALWSSVRMHISPVGANQVAAAWMTEKGNFMQLVTGFICDIENRICIRLV